MIRDMYVTAIILAAGSSRRMGFDKLFCKIDGKEVLLKSVLAFSNHDYIDEIIIVAGDNINQVKELVGTKNKVSCVIRGASTRDESVKCGINKIKTQGIVAIHDGARPFVTDKIIKDTIDTAFLYDAAAPAVAVKDTIKEAQNNMVMNTPKRKNLFAVQTPQVFKTQLYIQCMNSGSDKEVTDDCSVVENAGKLVTLVQGDYRNIKITTVEDLPSERTRENVKMRIGHGYDVHKLVEGRELILGGVKLEYELGLLGHSDADVLCHAITDALLGAMAMGDIGKHFPDTSDEYKGADSLILLSKAYEKIKAKGYAVANIDSTIICQAPKLAGFIDKMRENIAKTLGCDVDCVSIKATTEEKLGFTGASEGISAHAVAILKEI